MDDKDPRSFYFYDSKRFISFDHHQFHKAPPLHFRNRDKILCYGGDDVYTWEQGWMCNGTEIEYWGDFIVIEVEDSVKYYSYGKSSMSSKSSKSLILSMDRYLEMISDSISDKLERGWRYFMFQTDIKPSYMLFKVCRVSRSVVNPSLSPSELYMR